jgi:glycosyltransferase involved in cell wall biosynthesis
VSRALIYKILIIWFRAKARFSGELPPINNVGPDIARIRAAFLTTPRMDHYKWFWFQDLIPFFAIRPLLRKDQKCILQLHYPELPSVQVADNSFYTNADQKFFAHLEKWALETANIIVLANEGAKKIYGSLIPDSQEVMFLQNAMEPQIPGEIPFLSSKFTNLLFVGRRNKVKGFDLLLEAFARAHSENSGLRLYLCGNGEPVIQAGVVDLGFSKVPEKWLAAADAILIPNRSSYLDLNLIQALALNKPVIMSCTEGHEIFRDSSNAILHVQPLSIDSLTTALLKVPQWISSLGDSNTENLDLFRAQFGLDLFERSLNSICADILDSTATSK